MIHQFPRPLFRSIGVAIVLLTSGCATIKTSYSSYTNDALQPKTADQVKVYRTSTPDQPYEEIGMIQADGAPKDTAADMIEAIRAKAAAAGADAVIIQEMGESMRGIMPMGGMLIPIQRKVYNATAVRFRTSPDKTNEAQLPLSP